MIASEEPRQASAAGAPSRRRCLVCSLCAILVVAVLSSNTVSASLPVPSLRLVRASETITLHNHGGWVSLDLGLWVASVDGSFEMRVSRDSGAASPVAVQATASSNAAVRHIPSDLLDGFLGLERFITISVAQPDKDIVRRRSYTFCPNTSRPERITNRYLTPSPYPLSCSGLFPFTKGDVWGIHDGMAAPAIAERHPSGDELTPRMRLAPGNYTVTAEITRPYQELFDIAFGHAHTTIQLRVVEPAHRSFAQGRAPTRPGPSRVPPRSHHGRNAYRQNAQSSAASTQIPDLIALPAWGVATQNTKSRQLLVFAATIWNGGTAPLIVDAFRETDGDTMTAYQRTGDEGSSGSVHTEAIGAMEFDWRTGHEHWHFEDFANFRLVSQSSGEILRSKKQAFCLLSTDAVDLTLEHASWIPSDDQSSCGDETALSVHQRLDVGWGDTYSQELPGQAFDVTDVPNGLYYIEVRANSRGRIIESTTENNIQRRLIELKGKGLARRVIVGTWEGINP